MLYVHVFSALDHYSSLHITNGVIFLNSKVYHATPLLNNLPWLPIAYKIESKFPNKISKALPV